LKLTTVFVTDSASNNIGKKVAGGVLDFERASNTRGLLEEHNTIARA
jgi:hypothetical protein